MITVKILKAELENEVKAESEKASNCENEKNDFKSKYEEKVDR